MFNETLIQSESDFAQAHKGLHCFSADRKNQISQLRSALRSELSPADNFKSIVTDIMQKRKQVDQTFHYIKETFYELHGV